MAVSSTITGNPQVGQTFTESGSATNGEVLTGRQWQSAGTSGGTFSNISGATNQTFVTGSAQQGQYIRCNVSYDDGGNTVFAVSNVIGPIGRGSGGSKGGVRKFASADPLQVTMVPIKKTVKPFQLWSG